MVTGRLWYKGGFVSFNILKGDELLYARSFKCELQSRDLTKLTALKIMLSWLRAGGINETFNLEVVGANIEKWVLGYCIPPDDKLRAVFSVQRVLNSCSFDVNFVQKKRMTGELMDQPKVEKSLVTMMSEMGEDDE